MKKITIIVMMSAMGFIGHAQSPTDFKLGAGLSFSLPAYNMSPVEKGGGVDVHAAYFFTDKLGITADAGVSIFFASNGIAPTFLVPVRAGIKYFVVDNLFVFAKGGIGFYMLKTLDNTATRKFGALSGGAGYRISKKFDVQLSYDGYSNNKGSFAHTQARLGYYFLR